MVPENVVSSLQTLSCCLSSPAQLLSAPFQGFSMATVAKWACLRRKREPASDSCQSEAEMRRGKVQFLALNLHVHVAVAWIGWLLLPHWQNCTRKILPDHKKNQLVGTESILLRLAFVSLEDKPIYSHVCKISTQVYNAWLCSLLKRSELNVVRGF